MVYSQNGVDWQSIPSPPSTVGWIAATGEQLYVAPAGAPDAVYLTDDRGGTWTALEAEDPPESVAGFHAGGAGAVFTGSEDGLWLLDGESFRNVATPAPFAQVLVLDTGFFALPLDDTARESYWRSDDGRAWVEATDVPTDSPSGEPVYLDWVGHIG